jgi:signal transduction histidine kinase
MDQLLKFERAGQAKIELESVDLGEIVKDAVESLGSVIRSTGAVIETSALGKILGDATQLRALFQNLISNAIKFRREGVTPQVRIESSIAVDETGRWQEVRVIDNGRGFGPEVPSLMFKPFCRFKSSSGTEGFGVGLSTCRKIVMRHQGLIKAEGQLNEGATFFIRFPLASR